MLLRPPPLRKPVMRVSLPSITMMGMATLVATAAQVRLPSRVMSSTLKLHRLQEGTISMSLPSRVNTTGLGSRSSSASSTRNISHRLNILINSASPLVNISSKLLPYPIPPLSWMLFETIYNSSSMVNRSRIPFAHSLVINSSLLYVHKNHISKVMHPSYLKMLLL